MIDDIDLKSIGRKCKTNHYLDITEHVMFLDSTPFIFTGTIRDNINPFP